MLADKARIRPASTEALFTFLGNLPWWAIIIGIIGLIVSFSVLTSVRYRDAIYFIFDLPWDKELVAEMPANAESWVYTPDPSVPLRPGTYRFYAEFYRAEAAARENVILRETPATEAPRSLTLVAGERVTFERWHIVPKQGLTPEQNWVYIVTKSGVGGWALDRQFERPAYQLVARTDRYVVRVPQGAPAVVAEPVGQPGTREVNTSTPTLTGAVPAGGVWVRLINKFTWSQTVQRAWLSKGIMLTLRATLLGFTLALALGLLAGLMLVSRNPISLAISKLYVEVVRGIPLLVIILYAGFVLAPYLREATNGRLDFSGFTGAVIGLGFGYGAYLAEVFRAGIQSIHRGQMEAARSLGMSYFQAMRYVVLPQAVRVVLPPLGNDFMAMLKDSSLISVVALPEILQQGRLWVSRTFRAFEGYNTVALMYLVMTLLLSLLVRVIERRTALPGQSSEE